MADSRPDESCCCSLLRVRTRGSGQHAQRACALTQCVIKDGIRLMLLDIIYVLQYKVASRNTNAYARSSSMSNSSRFNDSIVYA